MPNQDAPAYKQGLVVFIDALGMSSATLDDCAKFVAVRDQILVPILSWASQVNQHYLAVQENIQQHPEKTWVVNFPPDDTDYEPPVILSFGDNIVLTWNVGAKNSRLIADICAGFILMFRRALEHKLLFRGAIAFGDYYLNGNTVLGPALTDAVRWGEKCRLDWGGIVFTEQCAEHLEGATLQVGVDFNGYNVEQLFPRYDVPAKDAGSHSLRCVGWPYAYAFDFLTTARPALSVAETKGLLETHLSQCATNGAISKYVNTRAFLDYWVSQYHPSSLA